MGLQERLEAAALERRRAAGLPSVDVTPPPPTPESDEVVLDVRPPAPVLDLRDASASPSFSTALTIADDPDACPSCGGATRLDMRDTVGGVDHYTCEQCGHLFQVAR